MTLLDPTEQSDPLDAAIGPDTVELGPWRRRLIQYQRVAGGFMILKGLTHWSTLFGMNGGISHFQQQPLDAQAATVFFAVIDLVAGVALWLGSTWGAMLWLFALAMQILANVIVLELSGLVILLTIVQVLLVAGYVILRFMVHQETAGRR